MTNPDVMVLGDSFSARNLWQSVFSNNTGYTVKSFNYEKNCISDWIEAALIDSTSKIIIIEIVERSFVGKFRHISSCPKTEPISLEIKAGLEGNQRPTWPLTLGFSYITTSAFNTIRSNFLNEKYSKRFRVVNASLRNGCSIFSNRRNDRLLYLADDDLKQQWNEQEIRDAVANVLKIQKEVERSGKKFVFVVAPDKSSVYKNCLLIDKTNSKEPNITDILIGSGVNAPNIKSRFTEKINVIVDLYDPDNTHWSEAGYILAGEKIERYISEALSGH